jgi:cytochrome bd-type quinol oxidase subunit 2
VPLDAGRQHVGHADRAARNRYRLVGAATIAMFAMHGSLYLVQKTEGDLQARIRRAVPRLIAAVLRAQHGRRGRDAALPGPDHDQLRRRHLARHLPGGLLVAILMAYRFVRQGREFAAFLASAATIALFVISGAAGCSRTSSSRPPTPRTT